MTQPKKWRPENRILGVILDMIQLSEAEIETNSTGTTNSLEAERAVRDIELISSTLRKHDAAQLNHAIGSIFIQVLDASEKSLKTARRQAGRIRLSGARSRKASGGEIVDEIVKRHALARYSENKSLDPSKIARLIVDDVNLEIQSLMKQPKIASEDKNRKRCYIKMLMSDDVNLEIPVLLDLPEKSLPKKLGTRSLSIRTIREKVGHLNLWKTKPVFGRTK